MRIFSSSGVSTTSSGVAGAAAPARSLPGCAKAGNSHFAFLMRSVDVARYDMNGSRTLARTSSRSLPTNVCSMRLTVPSPACPWARRASRYTAILATRSATLCPSMLVSRLAPSSPAKRKVSGLPAAVIHRGGSACTGRGWTRTWISSPLPLRAATDSPRHSLRTLSIPRIMTFLRSA